MINKIPPQAVEAEQAVLGAMLIEQPAVSLVLSILNREAFYNPINQKVFDAILAVKSRGEGVDMITVSREAAKGWEFTDSAAYYITNLTSKVNSAANTEYHCRIIQQQYVKRETINATYELHAQAHNEASDPFEILSTAQRTLSRLTDVLSTRQSLSAYQLYSKAFEQIKTSMTKKGLTGVPSGIRSLDLITGGWQKTDLIILAARPGMGKTAAVVTLARNAAVDFGMPGAIFTLEMSNMQLMYRLIAYESEGTATPYTNSQLAKGKIDTLEACNQLATDVQKIASHNILIDDTASISIQHLQAKAMKLKEEKGIQWLMVDYLQLMRGVDSNNREREIASISGGLKQLAKTLNIPVIALAQLSREVEKRADKKPQLSDLRESGSLEQDADIVMFLYRDEYYYPEDHSQHNPELKDKCEWIIAKHRSGAIADLTLGCKIAHSKFYDLDAVNWFAQHANTQRLPESTFETQEAPF